MEESDGIGKSQLTRRDLVKLGVAASASGVLAGVGARSAFGLPAGYLRVREPAASTTITVACFYDVTSNSGWPGLVKQFQQSHPGVTVDTQISADNTAYVAKLLSQKVSGTLPDILGLENGYMFPFFQQNGAVASLSPYLGAGFSASDYQPKVLDRYTVGGQVFGLPYDLQPVNIVYINKRLFREAGLAVPRQNWTWNQIVTLAKKLTKMKNGKTVQYGWDLTAEGTGYWSFMYAYGANFVDNVKHPTKVTTDDPRAIKAVTDYVDLMRKYKVSPTNADLSNSGVSSSELFAEGKTAMYWNAYWNVVTVPPAFGGKIGTNNSDLAVLELPAGPGGRHYQTGGTAFCLSTGSKNAQVAWEFLKFWGGTPGWTAAAGTGQAIFPPVYIPAYKQIFMKQQEGKILSHNTNWPIPNKNVNAAGAPYVEFLPFDPAWNEIFSKYIDPTERLMETGRQPIASTMKQWAKTFTPMLTANKKK